MNSVVESIRFWIPFFLVPWVFGYFSSRQGGTEQMVRVPIWLFYICGAPQQNRSQIGMLTRAGAFMQLFGILTLLFAIFFDSYMPDKNLGGLIGIASSLLGSVIAISILSHNSHKT